MSLYKWTVPFLDLAALHLPVAYKFVVYTTIQLERKRNMDNNRTTGIKSHTTAVYGITHFTPNGLIYLVISLWPFLCPYPCWEGSYTPPPIRGNGWGHPFCDLTSITRYMCEGWGWCKFWLWRAVCKGFPSVLPVFDKLDIEEVGLPQESSRREGPKDVTQKLENEASILPLVTLSPILGQPEGHTTWYHLWSPGEQMAMVLQLQNPRKNLSGFLRMVKALMDTYSITWSGHARGDPLLQQKVKHK